MENKVILVDTSIFIDFYRKTDKNNSAWISLLRKGYEFSISAVTKYEILAGATESQLEFWNNIFDIITVLPFNESAVNKALEINLKLKRKRKQIDIADLFIAATALDKNIPFATLNKKHFDRIDDLVIID